ncbi:MAG: DUF2800 domain-containing protein, partial [Burkholderiales bacterium]|nr:DUF2800 domain-containing protein [Burkholderiales bacterium]
REGSCAHGVSECRIRQWLASNGVTIAGETDESLVPDYDEFFSTAFSASVQAYVDFATGKIEEAWEQHGRENVVILLEQRLDFSRWVSEGFGTGDLVLIVPGKVIVIDLKFGAGVFVDGEDNSQIRLYGLGAYASYDVLYDFEEVEVWIAQPRKDNYGGETLTVEELLAWADAEVKPKAQIAWAAYMGDRSQAKFVPGRHCKDGFCKARFTCTARALDALGVWEDPRIQNGPDTLPLDVVESLLWRAYPIVAWHKDAEKHVLTQANSGAALTKYKLVEGRSNRVIKDEVAAYKKLLEHAGENSYSPDDLVTIPELRGLTDLEQIVGKKKLTEILGDLIEKPKGAVKLAPINSNKEAVEPKRSSAQSDFDGID